MPVEGNPSKKVEDLSPAPMSIAIPEPLTTKDGDVKESQETIMTNNNDQVQGNPSQIMENSSSIVIWELEQLVSKNCLDYENLSLLTDFLVKHPSVLLRDTSLGSSHSKFVELLQEVRSFGFDKDWLDSVERRALFSDIQVSQDALQKLLESKQQVSKEVEVLRMKIDIFNQHVEDLKHQLTSSEAVLESIIQQEAQVLETKAALMSSLLVFQVQTDVCSALFFPEKQGLNCGLNSEDDDVYLIRRMMKNHNEASTRKYKHPIMSHSVLGFTCHVEEVVNAAATAPPATVLALLRYLNEQHSALWALLV
ncbi:putative CC-NBS-LRR resistance protein [Trifolium pratense]|uniref:Putative CC-NBS-LRR resistance protein n=1 Tax=Trifolium pratense TaxID=57577 RepID=A0A2K3L4Z4_TRIPR|nr:putative CC-NBS-LRR resistance protein [Trifolium pratense]